MSINIKPSTHIERKLLFIETLLNTTDKLSKISEDSVLAGVASGIAKVAGKAEKDIAVAVSTMFPSTAFAEQLDVCAQTFGIAPRLGAIGSATYVRISAAPGTQYLVNTHTFKSTSGISFKLAENITIPAIGFAYAKVQSVETGLTSNVDPLSITTVTPEPVGHLNVVNEYRADGGRDVESDEMLRRRIKYGANILARGTLSMLEQVFISINPKVLKLFYEGHNDNGKLVIAVQTQNGADLTDSELNQLLTGSKEYFTLTELQPYGSNYIGIVLKNVTYGAVDISFRVQLNPAYNSDEIRKKIQVAISKYLDPRFFDSVRQKVEWDNLLDIVKNTAGVDYVPDQYFFPRSDVSFYGAVIPRLRGFLMLNLQGAIISDYRGNLSPEFYPNEINQAYWSTVLNK
jgi:hypothetical protein